MSVEPIVPDSFVVPLELLTQNTVLRPLRAEHNASDHAAWTSSIAHIKATPGFGPPHIWPEAVMSLEQNLVDIEMHTKHFDERVGFTYSVFDRNDTNEVVGCVYIYSSPVRSHDAEVRSWAAASRPELDVEVWLAVSEWVRDSWPFESVRYAPRPSTGTLEAEAHHL